MVIQRIQTLWLLIALILMVATTAATYSALPLLVINALTVVLVAASIFMYKDLRKQMIVTRTNMMLTAASLVVASTIAYVSDNEITMLAALPAPAFILELLALRGMKKDHKLLTSTDRLR